MKEMPRRSSELVHGVLLSVVIMLSLMISVDPSIIYVVMSGKDQLGDVQVH